MKRESTKSLGVEAEFSFLRADGFEVFVAFSVEGFGDFEFFEAGGKGEKVFGLVKGTPQYT